MADASESAVWIPEPRQTHQEHRDPKKCLRERNHIIAVAHFTNDEAAKHQGHDEKKEKKAIEQIYAYRTLRQTRRYSYDEYAKRNQRQRVAHQRLESGLYRLVRKQ